MEDKQFQELQKLVDEMKREEIEKIDSETLRFVGWLETGPKLKGSERT